VSSVAEHLPLDIAAFLAEPAHSANKVDIEETLSIDMAQSLLAGIASLGVCWDAADLRGLQRRPYRTDHLALVAHPGHPLASRQSCSFVDTLQFEHVGLPARTAGHAMLAGAAAQAELRVEYRAALDLRRRAEGGGGEPWRHGGAGRGCAPYARAMDLRLVPLTDPWATRQLVITYVDERALSSSAKLLVDFLAGRGAA
jgi:DNA-binding transcriptional LysR family regulator